MQNSDLLEAIRRELNRLNSENAVVSLDPGFEPEAGELVRLQIEQSYWYLQPRELLNLLSDLSSGGGEDQIKQLIEKKGMKVWHGPSPTNSRDDY